MFTKPATESPSAYLCDFSGYLESGPHKEVRDVFRLGT